MKNSIKITFTIIVLLACSNIIKAQESTIPNIQTQFDSLSTGLISNRIPYGVLYDRVYPWSDLTSWKNTDTINKIRLQQAWYDLENSVMQNRSSTYRDMKSLVLSQTLNNQLPIVSIDYNFSDIDSNSFIDGRMDLDTLTGKIKDNNRTEIPYDTHHVAMSGFMATSALTNLIYRLKLSSALHLSNTQKVVNKVRITDLSTNNTIELLPTSDEYKTIEFSTEGIHIFRFEITFEDVTTATCFQQIEIKANPYKSLGDDCEPVHNIISSTIPFQGYDETVATTSHADYHIYYHYTTPTSGVCERVLRKPIIILDGFDPQDGRNYYKIYNTNLSYMNQSNNRILLGDLLRQKGFDVVILNFPNLGSPYDPSDPNLIIPTTVTTASNVIVNVGNRDGGADYIERNAFLLVSLIQKINDEKVGTEKLVIVGPSMGGQISRFALAYMEKQNALSVPKMNHDTRLWVSFDSPHEGANIAISAQQFLYHMGYQFGDQDAKDKYEGQLRSKAARQLLIEQMDGLNRSASFHSTYYANLEANGLPNSHGYPQNLRKITLINGSGAGTANGIADEIALQVDANATLKINGFVCTLRNMPLPNQSGLTADILARDPVKKFFGLPYFFTSLTTANLTNNMQYKYRYSDFSIAYIINLKRVKTYKGEFTTTNANPRGSMDVVPGGMYNVYQETKDGILGVLNATSSIQTQTWNPYLSKMAFIPTISSLGFKNPNFNWNSLINDRNLVCNNEIYFDNYYAPNVNENHTDLNIANVAWIEQEIDKGHADVNCAPICSSHFTSSLNTICINSNATLTLNTPIPNLSNYSTTWTCSPNIQIVSSTNNSVTVIGLSYGIDCFIKAEINNPCGANVVIENRNISVGKPLSPSPSISISPTVNCYKWDATVQFPTPPSGATFDWGVSVYPNCNTSSCLMTGTNAGTFSKLMTSGQYIQWSSSATNACGTEDNPGQILQLDVTSCSPFTAQLNYIGVPLKTNYPHNSITTPDDDIIIFPNPSLLIGQFQS